MAKRTNQYSDSSLYCEHANEMPHVCPCQEECYCRVHGNCQYRSPERLAHPVSPAADFVEFVMNYSSSSSSSATPQKPAEPKPPSSPAPPRPPKEASFTKSFGNIILTDESEKESTMNPSRPLVEEAKKLVAQHANLYGDLDYYIGKCKERNTLLNLLVQTFELREDEISKLQERVADLERRNQHLTDRVLRYALGKPQELPPEPPAESPAVKEPQTII